MTDGQSESCRDQIETSGGVCPKCGGSGQYRLEGEPFWRVCSCNHRVGITAAQAREIAREVALSRTVGDRLHEIAEFEAARAMDKYGNRLREMAREEAAKLWGEMAKVTSIVRLDDLPRHEPSGVYLGPDRMVDEDEHPLSRDQGSLDIAPVANYDDDGPVLSKRCVEDLCEAIHNRVQLCYRTSKREVVQDIRSVLNDFVADEPRTAPAADGGEEVTEFAEQWTLRKEGTGYTILDANGGIRGHYRDATVMGVHFGFALQERDKLQRELADLRQQLADATRVDERELFWLRDAIREHCRGLVVVIPKPWEVGSRELAEKLNADLGIDLEQEQHGGDSHNVG